MKYLKIKSKGIIQPEAFTLIGASTKKGDETKRGFFGSGAKYSLSSLIKNGVKFKVFAGKDEIKFSTKKVTFRGQEFEVIQVNGQDTSLTTTMGGDDWNDSFSYIREIYSNALDEDDNTKLEVTKELEGEDGYTSYFIEYNKDVEDFHKNIYSYFCTENPNVLHSNAKGSIYPGDTIRLFRKGILCYQDNNVRSLFNYNSPDFSINESRTLSDTWDGRYRVGLIWEKCTDKNLIKELLYGLEGGNVGTYEHSIYWNISPSFSEAWGNVVKDLKFVGLEHTEMFSKDEVKGRLRLPFDFLKKLRDSFKDIDILGLYDNADNFFTEVKSPKEVLINKVIDAVGLLLDTNYRHRWDNPKIRYVKFDRDNVYGMALNGDILLSVKLDTFSVDEIARIIIEENEHNLSGFSDETRGFQDHLFKLYFEELKTEKK